MYKFSVLTFIFGDYECLHEVLDIQTNVEYICVTDNKNLTSKTWKIVYDEINKDYTPFRKVIEVRYNPFKYVSTNVCLIIDGSIELKQIPYKLLNHVKYNYDISTFLHPTRENLYTELDAWNSLRNLDFTYINTCKNFLKTLNINSNYTGLFQVNMICVKNTKSTSIFLKKCYNIIISLCEKNNAFRVDQVIFSAILYILRKNIKSLIISPLELNGKYLQQYAHNSKNTLYITSKINLNKLQFGNYFNKKNIAYFIDNLEIKSNINLTIAICNFNTTEITNNCIKSIFEKSKLENFKIVILDNSTTEKFILRSEFKNKNITIIDNTNEKLLKFSKLIKQTNCIEISGNLNASLKHAYSIQFLLNICTTSDMLLLDSDTEIIHAIDFINRNYISIFDNSRYQYDFKLSKRRCLPFIQYFNIKLINQYNIKYFDINRMHGGINKDNSMIYDTGASFYEDLIMLNTQYKLINHTKYIIHFGAVSQKQLINNY